MEDLHGRRGPGVRVRCRTRSRPARAVVHHLDDADGAPAQERQQMTQVVALLSKTRQLGLFSSSLEYDDLPANVAHYARRALVDWTAATIGAVDEPSAKKMRQVVSDVGGGGPANVIGSNVTSNAVFAALANAYTSHLLDFDDCFNPLETTIHLSSCLWGAILAVGQQRKLSGKDVLTAY